MNASLDALKDTADTKREDDIETSQLKETVRAEVAVDQYPQGLRLVLLAGASAVAVFLIALDQVSACHLKTATAGPLLIRGIF